VRALAIELGHGVPGWPFGRLGLGAALGRAEPAYRSREAWIRVQRSGVGATPMHAIGLVTNGMLLCTLAKGCGTSLSCNGVVGLEVGPASRKSCPRLRGR